MLAALIDGMNDSDASSGAGATGAAKSSEKADKPAEPEGNKNGSNMASVIGIAEMCWGDVGLTLSMPRQGLGNAAIAAVADDEQKQRFAGKWAAMAITEPEAGSDSAAIRTTAIADGDEYVLNGEKIYVTAGDRADLIVVWASLDPKQRAGGDQVVRRRARQPRAEARPARAQARDQGLRHGQLHPHRLPGAEGEPARLPRDRHEEVVLRRDEDVRQHAAARRRDGGWPGQRLPRGDAQDPDEAGVEIDYDKPVNAQSGGRRRVHRARGRLRGGAPADARGRLDGGQPQAQLARGLLLEGQGRADRHRHGAALRGARRRRRLLPRARCSRSGPATRRSSTSSRAPSRSSC